MDHVWSLTAYREYRLFDCVVCKYLWDPDGIIPKIKSCDAWYGIAANK